MRRLAFVCTANICRSPLMRFAFVEAISSADDPNDWLVTSRGTRAHPQDRICEVSAKLLSSHPGGDAYVRTFRSKPVSASHAAMQQLLLVATREERAALAALSPAERARTFTLREAIWLGESEPSEREIARARTMVTVQGSDPLDAYATMLHWRRGMVGAAPANGPLARFAPHPLDIPDAHGRGPRQHSATLRRVRDHTTRFAGQVLDFFRAIE